VLGLPVGELGKRKGGGGKRRDQAKATRDRQENWY
jgi:hypothetical protein